MLLGMNDAALIQDEQELAEDNPYQLSDDKIREMVQALRDENDGVVRDYLEALSVASIGEFIAKITDEDRTNFITRYSNVIPPATYTELDYELLRKTLSVMSADEVAGIIKNLESDDALELLGPLSEEFKHDIIRRLSAKNRVAVEEGLSFPEESAGRLMQREVVAVPEFWTVGKTIDYLRAASDDLPDDFFDIIVVDHYYHAIGEIPLNRLVRTGRSVKINELTLDETHPIPATMDQEEVADIFRRDNIATAPVVDENGRLMGVITIDDIVDVIDEEAAEDILKMAGVDQGDLYRAILSTTGLRFRWLFVNLITAIAASVVISFFDATIEQLVALAILMPIVASMGGNAGTQSLTVAVRALSMRQLSAANTWRIIWKETAVGFLNGVLFAVIIGLMAGAWFDNPMLGTIIAIAMIVNLIVAGLFGAAIPVIVSRLGSDPAVSSTVLLTTITDIVGFFAFLGLASIFLL